MSSVLKVDKITMDGKVLGSVDVSPVIFGADVRKDLIHRVVCWQMARRRSGNHKAKSVGEVSGTKKKPYKQKGSGRARLGSLRAPQCRGGATIFGPVVRSHSYSLPKKVRRKGLQSALSALFREGRIVMVDDMVCSSGKAKDFAAPFQGSVLMVGGDRVCENLKRAVANRHFMNVLPQMGVNVLDLLRHDKVILSKAAVDYLEGFLSKEGVAS
jgi:large subunit ribosomal protein L4